MMYPTPLSLLCALLLCLPLAVIFTVTSPTTTSAPISSDADEPSLTLSVPKPKRFTPPPIPRDDESLFRLAAQANPRPTSPEKLAFMFLTTTPLHLAPLWEIYFNRTTKKLYNIYIHADPSFKYNPPFSGVFTNRTIPSKPSLRFTPTLISAARRLLAHALLHDSGNYMFAILSPSCIPLHSFNFTFRTLMKSKKSFIEVLNNESGAYDRWAARGEEAMLPEVKFEDFRIGSQFWVLTRKHARLVVSDERIWNKFNQPCKREDTCYPEENYFSTLMHMQDPRGCVNATLTHVDWSVSSGGHPRQYNPPEVGPDLIRKLRKNRPRYGGDGINGTDSSVTEQHDPFLFARKFSRGSIQQLLKMANDVIFKDKDEELRRK